MVFKKYKGKEELPFTLRPEDRPIEKRQPKKKLSFYQKVKKGAMRSRVGYESAKRRLKAEKRSWTYILGGKGALISNIEHEKAREKAKLKWIRRKARSRYTNRPMQIQRPRPQPVFGEIDFGFSQPINDKKRKRR